MNFQFNVNLTENDYLEFNKFHAIRSPYAQKIIKSSKLGNILMLLCAAVAFVSDIMDAEAKYSYFVLPLVVLYFALQLLQPRILNWSVKFTVKNLKKKGKLPFTSSAVLEFYDEYFTETTESTKTEQKYSCVERVCIVDNKVIYIFISSVQACILPISVFQSAEEYTEFLSFIKTKCSAVEFY